MIVIQKTRRRRRGLDDGDLGQSGAAAVKEGSTEGGGVKRGETRVRETDHCRFTKNFWYCEFVSREKVNFSVIKGAVGGLARQFMRNKDTCSDPSTCDTIRKRLKAVNLQYSFKSSLLHKWKDATLVPL